MEHDGFGSAVSLNGNTIAIGSLSLNSVYIFVRSENVWVLEQQVTVDDATLSTFGFESLAVDGDTLVVSATSYYNRSVVSKVYIFARSGSVEEPIEENIMWNWELQQEIVVDGYGAGLLLAEPVVDLENDTLIVSFSDGVHVYARSHYNTDDILLTPFPNTSACFDGDISLFPDVVYPFSLSTDVWYLQQKITQPSGESENDFGASVSLYDDTIAIGSSGAVYVFIRFGTAWLYQQELIPEDDYGNTFGVSVAVDGDTIVVGAPDNPDIGGQHAGSIYVFTRFCPENTVWKQQQKITGPSNVSEDYFSLAVP